MKARDVEYYPIDTALHIRQFPHSGAPGSAAIHKKREKANVPSIAKSSRENIKIGRRDIGQEILNFFGSVPEPTARAVIVDYFEALAKSILKYPTAKVDKVASEAPADQQGTLPPNYRVNPGEGSELSALLSNPCTGNNCYTDVCGFSLYGRYHLRELANGETAVQFIPYNLGKPMRNRGPCVDVGHLFNLRVLVSFCL